MNTTASTNINLAHYASDFARMERTLRCCFADVPDVDDDCVPRNLLRDRLGACRADFERMASVMQRMLAN
jgi:hypothetical protein